MNATVADPRDALAARPAAVPAAAEPAELLITSTGLLPSVRSGSVRQAWSRLYRLGRHMVDMTLAPDHRRPLLSGQLLPEVGESVQVELSCDQGSVALAEVDASGFFSVALHPDRSYRLRLELDDRSFLVEGLSV